MGSLNVTGSLKPRTSQSPAKAVVACTRIRTSLFLGTGLATSWSCSTSGGPNFVMTMAFIFLLLCLSGCRQLDRDDRQAQVSNLVEHAVQGGLVEEQTLEQGGSIAGVGEGQALEPFSPAIIQVPLDADLITSGLVMFHSRCVCFAHRAPLAFPPFGDAASYSVDPPSG